MGVRLPIGEQASTIVMALAATTLLVVGTGGVNQPMEYGACPSTAVNCANGNCWINWILDSTCTSGYRCQSWLCTGSSVTIQACIQTSSKQSPPCTMGGTIVTCTATCYTWSGNCRETSANCNAPTCNAQGTGGTQVASYLAYNTCSAM